MEPGVVVDKQLALQIVLLDNKLQCQLTKAGKSEMPRAQLSNYVMVLFLSLRTKWKKNFELYGICVCHKYRFKDENQKSFINNDYLRSRARRMIGQ